MDATEQFRRLALAGLDRLTQALNLYTVRCAALDGSHRELADIREEAHQALDAYMDAQLGMTDETRKAVQAPPRPSVHWTPPRLLG